MRDVLAGHAAPVHLAAFLVLLRGRGETVAEVSGFLQAIWDVAVPVTVTPAERDALVDTCGTGGDRSGTINVSTTASFIVAAGGVPVAKHGNRASSSKSGAADVLEALGANIDLGPDEVVASIRETGLGFFLAPRFHPAFRHAGPVRKQLAVPTIMNFLGPLSNPAGVKRQVIGVSNSVMPSLLLEVLRERGADRILVVHGNDGLDELTVTGPSTIHELRDGDIRRYTFELDEIGLKPVAAEALCGDDATHNAQRARSILAGEIGPQADFVALNAAAAFVVGGRVDSLRDGFELAKSLLADGSAAEALERFLAATNRLGA
jgi:anthranilate phosphoribosyltransferase